MSQKKIGYNPPPDLKQQLEQREVAIDKIDEAVREKRELETRIMAALVEMEAYEYFTVNYRKLLRQLYTGGF